MSEQTKVTWKERGKRFVRIFFYAFTPTAIAYSAQFVEKLTWQNVALLSGAIAAVGTAYKAAIEPGLKPDDEGQ